MEWTESRSPGGWWSCDADSKAEVWFMNRGPPASVLGTARGTAWFLNWSTAEAKTQTAFSSLLHFWFKHSTTCETRLNGKASTSPWLSRALLSSLVPALSKSLGHPLQSGSPRGRVGLQGWQEPDFQWVSRNWGKKELFLDFPSRD